MSEERRFNDICQSSYRELSNDRMTALYYTISRDEGKSTRNYLALEILEPTTEAFGCSKYVLCGEEEPATEKQLNYISCLAPGFPIEAVFYKRQASMIIEKLIQRRNIFPEGCTFKQAKLLSMRTYKDVEKFTFEEAKDLISILQKHHFHKSAEFLKKVKEYDERHIVTPIVEEYGEIEIW